MIEQAAIFLGRQVHLRGIGRLLRVIYPCRWDSTRYVHGARKRGDGLLYEVDTRQVIDWCLLFHGEYEPHMRRLFQSLIGSEGVAIDVGANVGAHTLTLAALVGSDGRVLSFEPNPSIRQRLATNVRLNDMEQVTVYAEALAEVDGRLQLRVPKAGSAESSNPGLASLVALETPHDLVDVDVRRGDDLVQEAGVSRVDLVKIDVQGFELQVLRGLESTIDRFKPAILFEFEDWAWSAANSTLSDAVAFMKARSYRLWSIGANGQLVELGTKLPPHAELLALHEGDPRASRLAG